MFKMIVSDFDGTLCDEKKRVSERTLKAIKEYGTRGGIFAISTGRSPEIILPVMKKLGIGGIVSTFNGALVYDTEENKILYERKFTVEQTYKIVSALLGEGFYAQVNEKDRYFASEKNSYLETYQRITDSQAIIPDIPLDKYILREKVCAGKVVTLTSREERSDNIERVKRLAGDGYTVTSGADFIVEIGVKGCTKASSLVFLRDLFGLKKEEVLAVGDSLNDLEMLEEAGLGLCVGNADDLLKERTTVFGFTNEEDAVARIIEKYGV